MSSRLSMSYMPQVYKGFVDMETLLNIEDGLITLAEGEYEEAVNNQFVLTASLIGIQTYEQMLNIIPDPQTESDSFRRSRIINRLSMSVPFTFRFFKKKIDDIIGVGKWSAYMDFENYTLYIESSAANQLWFEEIRITYNSIKPANIVVINRPLITDSLVLSENISYNTIKHNYSLGVAWALGAKPFLSYVDGGGIKLENISSLTDVMLSQVASFAASDIHSVLINNTLEITDFTTKQATDSTITVEYIVLKSDASQITSVQLKNEGGDVLSSALVYVPMPEDVVMKHTITVKEGASI